MNRPKPLWKADDQKARLSELTAQSDDSAKDHALRRDVRSRVGGAGWTGVIQYRRGIAADHDSAPRAGRAQRCRRRSRRIDGQRTSDDFKNESRPRSSSHQGFRDLFRTGKSG